MAKQLSPIHFFRPGRHKPMASSTPIEFAGSDLRDAAAVYDPAVYRAPLVIGHPKLNAPAYGWVAGIDVGAEDHLYANPEQVEPQFADLVAEGRYTKVSASWFSPRHPGNPKPGHWYLKHIGFLGATPPAVSGLEEVKAFAADDEAEIVTVEFAGWDDRTNASLWRRLREWLIGERGQEVADQVVPHYEVASLEEAASREIERGMAAEAAAPITPLYAAGDDDMTPEQKAQLEALQAKTAALEQENAALKAQTADFADREAELAAREAEAQRAEIAEFAEGLIQAGKVLPRDRPGLVAYLAGPDDAGQIEFAQGDETIKKPGDQWLRDFLTALPAQVDFAERGAPEADDAARVEFAAPDGAQVDQQALAVHAKALAYQREHQCGYSQAVDAVMAAG